MYTDIQHYSFDEIQTLLERAIEAYLQQDPNSTKKEAIKNDTEFSEVTSILENMNILKDSETMLSKYPKEYKDIQQSKKNITTFFNAQCRYLLHDIEHPSRPMKKALVTNLGVDEKDIRAKQNISDKKLELKINAMMSLVKTLQKEPTEENIENFILFDTHNNIPLELLNYADNNPQIYDLTKEDYDYIKRTEESLMSIYIEYRNIGWQIIAQHK